MVALPFYSAALYVFLPTENCYAECGMSTNLSDVSLWLANVGGKIEQYQEGHEMLVQLSWFW